MLAALRCEHERAGPITPAGAFRAMVLAALVLSAGNAIAIEQGIAFPEMGLRLLHHATDLFENVALAILGGGLVAALVRYVPRLAVPVTALLAVPAVHAAAGHTIWRKILIHFDGAVEWSLYVPAVALEASLAPLLFLLGHWLGSFRRAWVIAPLVALATLVINNLVQPDNYFGHHCMTACGVSLLAGPALARRFPGRSDSARWLRIAAPIALLLGLWPPSNAVRVELFKVPSSAAAWALATTLWRAPPATAPVTASAWLAGRSGDHPVATTPTALTDGPPAVVLVTIDATRADVVNRPFPEFSALRSNGALFANAISPASQTTASLTTLFSGRYLSQLKWESFGRGAKRFEYPAADPSPRFPEILTAAGVTTTLVGPVVFLNAEYGVARGFSDYHVIVQDASHAMGADVVNVLVDRIRASDPTRPAFFYAHLMEPHHPYDRGALRDGPSFERYASEVAIADQLVARIARAAEERFGSRAIVIVTSDHGEAFGEHRTLQHSKTVYQELLHVPLLVRGGRIAARRIDEPVGTIDLGPTILDLFGQPIPPTFMGQSLAPLLAGQAVHLERPLFAETRLRRAFFGEVKVIEDVRRRTVEAYDLTRDPNELDNLYGRDPRADTGLATLRTFFKDAPQLYWQ